MSGNTFSGTHAETPLNIRPTLPGGDARRNTHRGLHAGASRARIAGPVAALGLVADELAAAERALHDAVGSDVAALPHIARYLAASGGKRLRPAFVALGGLALGARPPSARLMCCGELIHLGSLLHDDVVDQGDVRRGRPAAHVVYGNAVSVLTGDFCVARALLLAAEEGGHAVSTALARTVAAMSEGEILQLQRAGDLRTDEATYLDIIDRKSATLVAWCASAVALRDAQADAAAALHAYGLLVGRAFQIADDVLDYRAAGDKVPGADLRERKVTLPLLLAMQRIEGLRERLEQAAPAADELGPLMHHVRAVGALDDALAAARDHVAHAIDALDPIPDGPGRDALVALAHAVVERTS